MSALELAPTPAGNRFRRDWDREAVLAAVVAWIEATGKPPTSTAWETGKPGKYASDALSKARRWQDVARICAEGTYPSNDTVRRIFGSFSAMLEAAGIPARPEGRTPRAVTEAQQDALAGRRQAQMSAGPDQLAHDLRVVAQARAANDGLALRAALMDLAATAMAWCDRIPNEDTEAAA